MSGKREKLIKLLDELEICMTTSRSNALKEEILDLFGEYSLDARELSFGDEQKDYNIYDENGNKLGLKEIAEVFLHYYPPDVFITKPKEIIEIQQGFLKLLAKLKEN